MPDLCRVIIAGNLTADLERRTQPDGTVVSVTTIGVGRTALVDGFPCTTTAHIPLVVVGATRAQQVAQQFGASSRVLIEGHLETRETLVVERLTRADGTGEVLVRVPRCDLVVVVDAILNAAASEPAVDAQRQPVRTAWDEAV